MWIAWWYQKHREINGGIRLDDDFQVYFAYTAMNYIELIQFVFCFYEILGPRGGYVLGTY